MEPILARGTRMETFRGFESLSLDADDFSRTVSSLSAVSIRTRGAS